jgi:SAM-dependent methyltransferase
MSSHEPSAETRRLVDAAGTDEDPTAWFDLLYRQAAEGRATVPWDSREPSLLLQEWVAEQRLEGTGRTAVVVGCGLGRDSELIGRLGFATTAFDLSPTAIDGARTRYPDSTVDYEVADLRALPHEWHRAFDLVVESLTIQSLPISLRATATRAVAGLVAPGGTLIVVADAREEGEDVAGPPWPLSRPEIDAFTATGLIPVSIEDVDLPDDEDPTFHRWRAEFRREA